ncbi:type II toxin-antitoxin system ParD family antitoxin [Rhizobium tumorigenes]
MLVPNVAFSYDTVILTPGKRSFYMRSSRPISVTLGTQQQSVDARVKSGSYNSASEVIRAALRALDREDEALSEIMRLKIQEAIDDPRPSLDAAEVFERIEKLHAERVRASGSEA